MVVTSDEIDVLHPGMVLVEAAYDREIVSVPHDSSAIDAIGHERAVGHETDSFDLRGMSVPCLRCMLAYADQGHGSIIGTRCDDLSTGRDGRTVDVLAIAKQYACVRSRGVPGSNEAIAIPGKQQWIPGTGRSSTSGTVLTVVITGQARLEIMNVYSIRFTQDHSEATVRGGGNEACGPLRSKSFAEHQ